MKPKGPPLTETCGVLLLTDSSRDSVIDAIVQVDFLRSRRRLNNAQLMFK